MTALDEYRKIDPILRDMTDKQLSELVIVLRNLVKNLLDSQLD
jgi:hypothetical protein